MNRILVIRGGAIGDFILTLPALKLLRDNFPAARIEILGHNRIVVLAENRFYADATRSIDRAPLARFFTCNSDLPADLVEYFARFDLILSYVFDPDGLFAGNLKRAGVTRLLTGSPKITGREHAARQLAQPLEVMGFHLDNAAAFIYPNEADRIAAREFLGGTEARVVAIHPGSGSAAKNWPLESWINLGDHLLSLENSRVTLVVVGGEADETQISRLRSIWKGQPVRFAIDLPLTQLAALLQDAVFVGHDSGISHLAAAAGAHCILLFGPTDPAVWAPKNPAVAILRAPGGNLRELSLETVRDALQPR